MRREATNSASHHISVTLRNVIISRATRKRTCTYASGAPTRIRWPTPTAAVSGRLCDPGQIKVFSSRGFTSRGVILAWERARVTHWNARSKIEPPLQTTARSYAFLSAAQQGKYTANVDS